MKHLVKFKSQALKYKNLAMLAILLIVSNMLTLIYSGKPIREPTPNGMSNLYLMGEAKKFVNDIKAFENKVNDISYALGVDPSWLMAVMHSESGFDAAVANYKGSGATGLIQFMPSTAKWLNTSVERLRNMNHIEQMDYVLAYLQAIKNKYGSFDSLTDLYLAVLYPTSLKEDYCYTLYANPSVSYKMNKGLDFNRDGRVTVSDIDKRLKKRYPDAYIAEKPAPGMFKRLRDKLSLSGDG